MFPWKCMMMCSFCNIVFFITVYVIFFQKSSEPIVSITQIWKWDNHIFYTFYSLFRQHESSSLWQDMEATDRILWIVWLCENTWRISTCLNHLHQNTSDRQCRHNTDDTACAIWWGPCAVSIKERHLGKIWKLKTKGRMIH